MWPLHVTIASSRSTGLPCPMIFTRSMLSSRSRHEGLLVQVLDGPEADADLQVDVAVVAEAEEGVVGHHVLVGEDRGPLPTVCTPDAPPHLSSILSSAVLRVAAWMLLQYSFSQAISSRHKM